MFWFGWAIVSLECLVYIWFQNELNKICLGVISWSIFHISFALWKSVRFKKIYCLFSIVSPNVILKLADQFVLWNLFQCQFISESNWFHTQFHQSSLGIRVKPFLTNYWKEKPGLFSTIPFYIKLYCFSDLTKIHLQVTFKTSYNWFLQYL